MKVHVYRNHTDMLINDEPIIVANVVGFGESSVGGWFVETKGTNYLFPKDVCIMVDKEEK